jgi:F0F1-type ATP synthase membrane subunit c/vacuolar-type H+-ATPase subunit K
MSSGIDLLGAGLFVGLAGRGSNNWPLFVAYAAP